MNLEEASLHEVWVAAVDHQLAADVFVALAALAFAAATFLYGVIASSSKARADLQRSVQSIPATLAGTISGGGGKAPEDFEEQVASVIGTAIDEPMGRLTLEEAQSRKAARKMLWAFGIFLFGVIEAFSLDILAPAEPVTGLVWADVILSSALLAAGMICFVLGFRHFGKML